MEGSSTLLQWRLHVSFDETQEVTKAPASRVLSRMPTAQDRQEGSKLWHDASVLRKLYAEEGRTQAQIAKQLGCSTLTINKAFKKFGIQAMRGRRPAKQNQRVGVAPPRGARIVAVNPGGISPTMAKDRFNELIEVMEKLGPHARDGVKRDLHNLIDRL